MAELGGDRTHLVEDEGGRGLPMRPIKSDQPKMSLQQVSLEHNLASQG